MYRHFQNWNHTGQEVVTYLALMDTNKYTVRVIYCTPKQATSLEKQLIIKYQPRDCENKYQGYKPNRYDKEVILNYAKTGNSSFKYTKKELEHFQQVLKEDKEFQEEQERQPKAMFGDENSLDQKFSLLKGTPDNNGASNYFVFLYTMNPETFKIKYVTIPINEKKIKDFAKLLGVEIEENA
jgi:hypothetical protein